MRYVFFFILTSFINISLAAENDLSAYLVAQKAIKDGALLSEFDTLQQHALYPYLADTHFKNNSISDKEIKNLSLNFFHAKPVKDIMNKWVSDKFSEGEYESLTNIYFDTGDKKSECYYLQSLLYLGKKSVAIKGIKQLWHTTESLPDECNNAISAWEGSIDNAERIRRAEKAYFAKNFTLSRHLTDNISDNKAQIIHTFSELAINPENLRSISLERYAQNNIYKRYLPLALAELARKDSIESTNIILQFHPFLSDSDDFNKLLNTLTIYLVNRDSAMCLDVFRKIPSNSVEKKTEETITHFLINSYRTSDISIHISNPKFSKAQYWLGKALDSQGKTSEAKKWWEKAVLTRSYYGFLAADKLNLEYSMNFEPTDVRSIAQNNLNRNNNLIRASLLRQIGDHTNARREILQIYNKMAKSDTPQLAAWLNDNGFYFESIYLFGKIRHWNDVKRRFPTPFNAEVSVGASMVGIPESWVYSIIRQESTMNRFAVSRSKAKGLMQLIPSTARSMARKVGVSSSDIFDAGSNVMMGSQYLSDMYNRFGNTALASAAYNAGPSRVDQWTENGIGDIEEWVERIPFKETRKYVKNILEYRMVYQKLLGKGNKRISDVLKEGIISNKSLM